MKSYKILIGLFTFVLLCLVLTTNLAFKNKAPNYTADDLRAIYSSGDKSKWPLPNIDESVRKTFKEIGNLDSMQFPTDNMYSDAKKELGKILFFDPRLSKSEQIACASCHDSQLGWGDGKRVAFGHNRQTGTRNAMSLFNIGFYNSLFWDGRAFSIEHQANFPTADPLEMAQPLGGLDKKIKKYKGYKTLFAKAFGNEEITNDKIFKAIATFERTIVSPKSRFDQFINGKKEVLSDDEVTGLHLFRTKARCVNCHNSGLFSDNQFHNDGQTLFGSDNEDLGLYNSTKKLEDVGKFRTQSLRETANTGPWMHHGNFPTLKDVVQFYNLGNPAPIPKRYKGDRDSLLPKTSPILQKLNLTDIEINQVIAFLQSITTTPQRVKPITDFPK
jgi:cytochrome c peroxidase